MHSKSKNGVTCLHLACASGNLDIVRYLLDEHNFDCSVKSTASGTQPIHAATNAGHTHVVKYLIEERGVNPKDEDRNEENCLTLAIKNRKRAVALMLVQLNVYPLDQIISRRGFNYFAYALVKGQQVVANEIFKVLGMKGKATPEVLN